MRATCSHTKFGIAVFGSMSVGRFDHGKKKVVGSRRQQRPLGKRGRELLFNWGMEGGGMVLTADSPPWQGQILVRVGGPRVVQLADMDDQEVTTPDASAGRPISSIDAD